MLRQEWVEFVKAAIRSPMEVSTIFPTSKFLAEALLDLAGLEQNGTVAEIGCGTGAITKYLEPRLKEPGRYLGIELNGDMVDFMRKNFPALRFEEGPADALLEFTAPNTVTSVVSSLPWTVFDKNLQKQTLNAVVESMADGGTFVTYVCVNASWYPQAQHFGGLLHGMFSSVKKSPVEWRNIPPAFVYVCQK